MNRIVSHSRSADLLPKAKIEHSRLSWLLWLIPLAAAGICVWFFYRDYIAAGPTLTIIFENADGLEVRNTQLRYRGATVGVVKDIELTDDKKHVVVTAQLAGAAKSLARAGSVFWIVRPEVKIGSVSGLRTIISGEYIAVEPGEGAATNNFSGAEKEPVAEEPGALRITVVAPNLGAMQEQSPIFYRGIEVGEVLSYRLASNAREVLIQARVHEAYAPLVRTDSKFWNVGGLNLHVGLFKGLEIGAESPKTIISGGIEFATPTTYAVAATNGTVFVLNEKSENEWKAWTPNITVHVPDQGTQTNAPMTSLNSTATSLLNGGK